MKLFWLDTAVEDLQKIYDYISTDSEYYAIQFTQKIMDCVELIPSTPKFGRIVPEIKKKEVREMIYHNYRIIYRIKEEHIEILAIIHGSRNLNRKRNRKWEII